MADYCMAVAWKDDGPAIGHGDGNNLRPTGRAESIAFGADRKIVGHQPGLP